MCVATVSRAVNFLREWSVPSKIRTYSYGLLGYRIVLSQSTELANMEQDNENQASGRCNDHPKYVWKKKTGSSSVSSSQSQNISDDRLLARISHRTGTRGREVSHESFGRSHDSTRSYALAPNVADECWARVTY